MWLFCKIERYWYIAEKNPNNPTVTSVTSPHKRGDNETTKICNPLFHHTASSSQTQSLLSSSSFSHFLWSTMLIPISRPYEIERGSPWNTSSTRSMGFFVLQKYRITVLQNRALPKKSKYLWICESVILSNYWISDLVEDSQGSHSSWSCQSWTSRSSIVSAKR